MMTKDFATAFALSAMEKTGLGPDWTFGFDEHPVRMSSVRLARQHLTISLSTPYTDYEIMLDFFHNCAHAKCGNLEHDSRWAEAAGAAAIVRCGGAIPSAYEAICKCGRVFYRTKPVEDPQVIHMEDCNSTLTFW